MLVLQSCFGLHAARNLVFVLNYFAAFNLKSSRSKLSGARFWRSRGWLLMVFGQLCLAPRCVRFLRLYLIRRPSKDRRFCISAWLSGPVIIFYKRRFIFSLFESLCKVLLFKTNLRLWGDNTAIQWIHMTVRLYRVHNNWFLLKSRIDSLKVFRLFWRDILHWR